VFRSSPAGAKFADKVDIKDVALVPSGATRQDVERQLPPRYALWAREPGTSNWVQLAPEWRADPALARERAVDPEALAFTDRPNIAPGQRPQDPTVTNRRDAFRANRGN